LPVPYEYDHFRIPWAEAVEHDPEDIILLCDRCHKLKTTGLLSTHAIEGALKKRTATRSETRFKIPVTANDFFVDWCGTRILATKNAILVDDEPILDFTLTENDLEPVVLNGVFRSPSGAVVCRIVNNGIAARADAIGDFTLEANRFRLRTWMAGTSCYFS
jgi:hypothetical protein